MGCVCVCVCVCVCFLKHRQAKTLASFIAQQICGIHPYSVDAPWPRTACSWGGLQMSGAQWSFMTLCCTQCRWMVNLTSERKGFCVAGACCLPTDFSMQQQN